MTIYSMYNAWHVYAWMKKSAIIVAKCSMHLSNITGPHDIIF